VGNSAGADKANSIKDNRLRVYEDKRFDYDAYGNLIEKRLGKHTVMRFSYDAEHQLNKAVINKNGVEQIYHYAYDPFGRRISKKDPFNTTAFVWDGNRLLSETRGSRCKTYVYEQAGFEPVAQLIEHLEVERETEETGKKTGESTSTECLYYHCDHLGTPREMTDTEGNIVWAAQYKAWGNTLRVEYPELEEKARPQRQTGPRYYDYQYRVDVKKEQAEKKALKVQIEQWHEDFNQPLRFQGQYFDEETGLHYNRFRYYDPDIGRFVSQDPVGFAGGDNFYQYAPNPTGWVDPFGLARKKDGGCDVTKNADDVIKQVKATKPQLCQIGKCVEFAKGRKLNNVTITIEIDRKERIPTIEKSP